MRDPGRRSELLRDSADLGPDGNALPLARDVGEDGARLLDHHDDDFVVPRGSDRHAGPDEAGLCGPDPSHGAPGFLAPRRWTVRHRLARYLATRSLKRRKTRRIGMANVTTSLPAKSRPMTRPCVSPTADPESPGRLHAPAVLSMTMTSSTRPIPAQ